MAEKLAAAAPRPVLVNAEGEEQSALSTLLPARMLPGLTQETSSTEGHATEA